MYPSNFFKCSCTWKWCTVESRGHYGIEKLWCYLKSPKSDKWRNEKKLEINQFWNFNKYYWLCHMRWPAYWIYSPFQKCSPFLQIFWSVFWQTIHNRYFILCDINNAAYWWLTIFHEVNKSSKILKFPYFYTLIQKSFYQKEKMVYLR